MELKSKEIQDNSALNRILILNKIRHKPLLLFNILPFINKRPFIMPYLIDSDFALKKSLKKTINKIKKKNFQAESIDNIYKFIIYKFLKEIDILSLGKFMLTSLINNSCSFRDNYKNYFISYFLYKKPIPQDLNIPYNLIYKFAPSGEILENFLEDYLFFNINLLYLPLSINSQLNNDSLYLYDLKENNKIHQLINLFCIINNNKYYNDIQTIYHKYINILYFYFDNNHSCENLFNIVFLYLEKIIHKENIKKIIFDDYSFSKAKLKEISIQYGLIYTKICLEYLVDNYFDIIKKGSKIDFNLSSLEEIDFSDDNIINNIQCFKLRYNLSKIFVNKNIFKVIWITNEDYNNIYNLSEEEQKKLMNKMNQFEKENNKNKILYLDFCNNSPYQKNFVFFCEKYLNLNNNINIIILDNIGENNKEYDLFSNKTNIKKIKLPSLKSIIYQKDITSNFYKNKKDRNNEFSYELYSQNFHLSLISCYANIKIIENEDMVFDRFGIKKFVNDFFDYSGLNVYEGYDNNNILVYLNIVDEILDNELYRIFFIQNKIFKLMLNNEKKQIKFDKSSNNLTLINYKKKKIKEVKCNITTFDEFLNKLNNKKNKKLENKKIYINEIISTSQILTTKSQYKLLINGLSEVLNKKHNIIYNLLYKGISDKSKIDTIIDIIGKNRYMLLLVKTNKGSIFGAFVFFKDSYPNENKGIVFNFIDEKIYYNAEGYICTNNKGIEVKD